MLNDWFTHAYRVHRQQFEQRIRRGEFPVLLRLGDELVGLWRERRVSQTVLSPRYHALKSICHLPLALFLVLPHGEDDEITSLQRTMLQELATMLATLDVGEDRAAARIVECCSTTLARVLETDAVRSRDLQALESCARGPTKACIESAARIELERTHDFVAGWTASFSRDDWRQLRVVIGAGHQARYRQTSRQYFERLLDECTGSDGAQNERRILYAENCDDEDAAVRLLAQQLLDRELAATFLESPLALQRDVIGSAAKRVIDELLPSAAERSAPGDERD